MLDEAKPRLLIVDDDDLVRQSLSRVMRKEFEIRTACDGDEALPLVLGGGFDVVLSDVDMPGMSGSEMLRRIRSADPWMAGGVVLMTGDAERPSVAALAAVAFVFPKPPDLPVLKAVLLGVARRPGP